MIPQDYSFNSYFTHAGYLPNMNQLTRISARGYLDYMYYYQFHSSTIGILEYHSIRELIDISIFMN
jgi:hypothetical protein